MRAINLQRIKLAALAACIVLWPGSGAELADQAAAGGAEMELQADAPALVAITFDDGPSAYNTKRLLEGLAMREVAATFFLLGERIQENEGLILQMVEDGHQIGIHTYDHAVMTDLSKRERNAQVKKTVALLEEILGPGEYWLRPPYGMVNQAIIKWADGPLILWSVDPEDWKQADVEQIVATVTEKAEDGDIILLHDIFGTSVDAALKIIDNLLERGYCFVTVKQMMQLRGITPQAGILYKNLPPIGIR